MAASPKFAWDDPLLLDQQLTDDERARVFERDFRRAERADGARRGRGLGLYFCRLVAEAHGGTITVGRTAELPVEFVLRLPVG